MNNDNFFGKQMKWWRLEKRITQDELAEKLCYDQADISKRENGKVMIDAEFIKKFCDICDITPNQFFDYKGKEGGWENSSDFNQDEKNKLVEDINTVITMIHTLTKKELDLLAHIGKYIN